MAKTAKKKASDGTRTDGRRALLLYLHPDVTLELKKAALVASKPAYELAEEAIRDWLRRKNRNG